MKIIKIIDLFYKIANGEEVPYKIMYGNHIYTYNSDVQDYDINDNCEYLFEHLFAYKDTSIILGLELEILDEEDEFEDITGWGKPALEELQTKDIKLRDLQSYMYLLAKDQNALIKNQKKIIERLKDE